MSRRLLCAVAVAGVLASALAGCDNDVPQTSGLSPAPAVSGAARQSGSVPVSPAAHKWKTDGLTCPTLSCAAARATGRAGAGQRVRGTDSAGSNTLVCRWGPEDETAASATVQIDTASEQQAADTAWQVLAGLYRTPLSGAGEQAFISPDIGDNQVNVVLRSGNAILNLKLIAKKDDAGGAQLLRDGAAQIATDMLSSLVPA